MSEITHGNFKIGCITCKRTPYQPEENVTNNSRLHFRMYSFTQKRLVNGMHENVASRRTLTKMTASVFHRIYKNIKFLMI